jgi:hypothetical protein
MIAMQSSLLLFTVAIIAFAQKMWRRKIVSSNAYSVQAYPHNTTETASAGPQGAVIKEWCDKCNQL